MNRLELHRQLVRYANGDLSTQALSEWAAQQIMENDNAGEALPEAEREFLQSYLEHCLFSVEPAFPLTPRNARALIELLTRGEDPWARPLPE